MQKCISIRWAVLLFLLFGIFTHQALLAQTHPKKPSIQPVQTKKKMIVEIWSDILCPWCYIGKREFEKALGEFAHKEDVEVIWHSYELDPNAPKEIHMDSYDLVAKKYGITREKSMSMHQNLVNRAAEVGLTYRMEKVIPTNSFDAHRVLHLAMTHGLQDKMIELLSAAYLTHGKNIGKLETLVELGVEAGLDANEVVRVIESDAFSAEVREDEHEARTLGITGVPFFAINRKYGISGAQPSSMFLANLNKIWEETPIEEQTSEAACTPEGNCEPKK